jgi:hypothetical protein
MAVSQLDKTKTLIKICKLTKLYFLVGASSLCPFGKAAFDALGIKWEYAWAKLFFLPFH